MASTYFDWSGDLNKKWPGKVNHSWHPDGQIALNVSGRATRDSDNDSTVHWAFDWSTDKLGRSYGYRLDLTISVDGVSSGATVYDGVGHTNTNMGTSGTIYIDAANTGSSAEVNLLGYCTFSNCTWEDYPDDGGYDQHRSMYFTQDIPPYVSDIPATNVTGGAVYNQNDVQNGQDKPDWNFYANWWGQSAGSHEITMINLDIYKSGAVVHSIVSAQPLQKYNFETLFPKCKPGDTYDFYTNVLIDNSYWLGLVYLGSIKLYKDGIIYVKDVSRS